MPAATTARAYRVSDTDVASRLSFFLWGTVPDAELLRAASTGGLRTQLGFEKQVKRMLADPRSRALADRFASQWLRLQDLEKIIPDYLIFPQYDETLGAAMGEETELFFDSIVREDRSVLDLLTADYSFVNERLAKHYGIPNVSGSTFQRVHGAGLPPRPARPGQHPDADLGGRSHLAGAARQVGDGSAAGLAAAGAAAQRAVARRLGEGECRRQDAVDARAHGRAPQEPVVQLVPPRDRSARPGARQLRRHRRVAHQGQRGPGRFGRRALRRHQDGRPRRAAQRDHQAPGRVPPQLHREDADLRARPPGGALRHADGARHRPRRDEEESEDVGLRAEHRQQPGIPHGGARRARPEECQRHGQGRPLARFQETR